MMDLASNTMGSLFERGFNVFLRLSSLTSKLIFVLILTRLLTSEELGGYVLFSSFVVYFVGLVGYELHTYSNREMLIGSVTREFVVLNLFFFNSFSLLVLLPMIYFIYNFAGGDEGLFLYFIVIILFELFTLEIFRILVVISKNIQASLVMFVKTALWIFIYLISALVNSQFIGMDGILIFWTGGLVVSFAVGVYFISNEVNLLKCFSINGVSLSWIVKGVKISSLMFLSAQAILLMYFLDKMFISTLGDVEMIAVYGVFLGFSGAIYSFVEASVIVYFYPRMVSEYAAGNFDVFNNLKRQFFLQVLFVNIVLMFILYFMVEIALIWIDKESYYDYIDVFYILMCSSLFKSLSTVPHYSLYSAKKDIKNILSNIGALVFFVISSVFLSFCYEIIYAVSYGVLIFFIAQFFLKCFFWGKLDGERGV